MEKFPSKSEITPFVGFVFSEILTPVMEMLLISVMFPVINRFCWAVILDTTNKKILMKRFFNKTIVYLVIITEWCNK